MPIDYLAKYLLESTEEWWYFKVFAFIPPFLTLSHILVQALLFCFYPLDYWSGLVHSPF